MEALEKDFQELVASEEQEILDAVEPIQEEPVAEEEHEDEDDEEEIDEDVLGSLEDIAKRHQAKRVKFGNKKSMTVDATTAIPRGNKKFLACPLATSTMSPVLPRPSTSERRRTFIILPLHQYQEQLLPLHQHQEQLHFDYLVFQ